MRKLSLLILAIGLLAVISPVSARVYRECGQDLGTFDFEATAVGDSIQITDMAIKIGIQTVLTGAYDDSITILTSQNGDDWVTVGSAISAEMTLYLEPVFEYIRIDPVGGGSEGSITVMLCQVYEL